MKYEIKFRGKKLYNNEWVSGDLIQYENGEMAIFSKKLSNYGHESTELFKRDKVFPETVGQFSEITDRNGKSIFNGDLILIHGSSCQLTVEVIFHKGMFCYKNKACGFTPLWYVSSICEVIGNIYDNSN